MEGNMQLVVYEVIHNGKENLGFYLPEGTVYRLSLKADRLTYIAGGWVKYDEIATQVIGDNLEFRLDKSKWSHDGKIRL
jgi:hypothetical protein